MSTREIIVDSFAGGGGASLGIAWAVGRAPDIAINHNEHALALHALNHPSTKHVNEDVWKADLRKLVGRKKVGLLWASPDCTDFSRAKGGTPVRKEIRSLAWIVVKWADQIKPRIICLENVREFADWGPIVPLWQCKACDWKGTEGQATLVRVRRRCPRCESLRLAKVQVLDKSGELVDAMTPDPAKRGFHFKRWLGRLRNLGYNVQYKTMDAADYGAPTHRKRLFLVARRDGQPIVWPEPTHGNPKKLADTPLFDRLLPWRTAAKCIDWSIPCPSIFDRKTPLKPNTERRVAHGLVRYVLENPKPFIVNIERSQSGFRGQQVNDPLGTVTAQPKGGKHSLVTPYIVKCNHGVDHFRGQPLEQPLSSVTGKHGYGVVAPVISQLAHGTGKGGLRSNNALDPLGTVHAGGGNHAMVAAMLAKFRGDSKGASLDDPMPTITSGAGATRPAGAAHALGVNAVYLARFNHGEKQWSPVDEPLGTITSQVNKFGLVYAFLMKYYGSGGQWGMPYDPLGTIPTKQRFGLVMVEIQPGQLEPAVALHVDGVGDCIVADIGLRMLTPRELARAQGFPDTYELRGPLYRQVAMIGNSVSPPMARAIVEANYCREVSHYG